MKRLSLFLLIVAGLLAVCEFSPVAAVVDLRSRIDGTSVYSNSDSLKLLAGTNYDGFSDTVSVTGAELISVDFILSRITATSATGIVTVLQGSKDGTSFITLPCLGDTTKITVVGIRSFIFPYTAAFTYYRLKVLSDTTFSAMIKWKVGERVNK